MKCSALSVNSGRFIMIQRVMVCSSGAMARRLSSRNFCWDGDSPCLLGLDSTEMNRDRADLSKVVSLVIMVMGDGVVGIMWKWFEDLFIFWEVFC